MAPRRDANQELAIREAGGGIPRLGRRGSRRSRWLRELSLRPRLLLLVVASVVPLIGMSVVREYHAYRTDREAVYDGLLATARGTAVVVERELQLRVSALQTLAMSPALQDGDLDLFDKEADAFLARQPGGSVMGLAARDQLLLRVYGVTADRVPPALRRDAHEAGKQVFDTGRPIVTDVYVGPVSKLVGFSVDVPVLRDGSVVYDLYLRLLPAMLEELIARQRLSPASALLVVDTRGMIVARSFGADGRRAGAPIVPDLWASVRARPEGVMKDLVSDGAPAVAAYAHVAPFGWAVVLVVPEESVFGPLRAGILQVAEMGMVVLAAAMMLAIWAAGGITRPIEQLGWLAAQDRQGDPAGSAATGLPETDVVARALLSAAAARRESAKALAESESRFRALFERSPSGMILLAPETARVIDSNAVAAAYAGCSVEALQGRVITDFWLQPGAERLRAMLREVVAGQSVSFETRTDGGSGPRDLLIALAPVRLAGETLVLGNQTDVTDLRRAEAGLRENEERLELARAGANLGIWDWDVAAGTLSWSERQWSLHGLEPLPDGPTPEIWRQAVHPADLSRVQEELLAALESPGRHFATEYSVILPDGSLRRLLGRGQTIRGEDGRPVRMVGINMDVTARYEAEMARDRLIWMLETERSRLSEIIEAMPIGVGIVDAEGHVILGNAVMKRLTGAIVASATPVRQGEWIAHDVTGRRLGDEDSPIRRALQRGETTLPGVEYLFRDGDGNETWFRVGGVPLRREDGDVSEALGIFLDIDAEKRLLAFQQRINAGLEQQVRAEMKAREAAQQRAAHAERMHALGQIAGGIAHDFNNVLQAVSGGAALIERFPGEAGRVLRNARIVLDAARRGAAITSRLLAFARRGDLRAENIDAAPLLSDMAEILTHTLGGSVVCRVEVAAGVPPLVADRGQLETVLVNLATNARDAMPSGGVLTLAADDEAVVGGQPPMAGVAHMVGLAPGRYVRITVSDTGVGMLHSVLEHVTEPFFTTKDPGKGTGLGLAMAKGFAEQSGGGLGIDSVVGQGTRVMLWLPAASGTVSLPAETVAVAPSAVERPRVLLVDDDATVREVLAVALADAGYAVVPVDGAGAALDRLATGEPVDIVVSDLTMPGMDGLELIRSVHERWPWLPAVLLTGYVGDGATVAVGGAVTGPFALLRKPVTSMELADRIHAMLASRKQPSPV